MKKRWSRLQKLISSPKGMSLVEIVLAVAILGIITIAFLNVFTISFKSVSISGSKSKVMTEASAKLERLYAEKDLSALTQEQVKVLIQAEPAGSEADLDDTATTTTWYYIEPVYGGCDYSGYSVTVSMAYRNQKNEIGRIKLTSYIRGGA